MARHGNRAVTDKACQTVFFHIVYPGGAPHEDDNLCGACLRLPKPPVPPYEKRDAEDTTA
jgi:hypothetical protein